MNSQKSLTYGMALLFLFVFVTFGVIIVHEKMDIIFIPRAEKIFDNYLQENYTSLYQNTKKSSISYENNTFKIKISSKKNSNLYFYLTYANKKVSDTYQKDYVEGNSLLTHTSKVITKDIKDKTSEKVTISIPNKLNTYTKRVQESILSEQNLSSLPIYTVSKELLIDNWNSDNIVNSILQFTSTLTKEEITPKSYTITLTEKNNITNSLKISNLQNTSLEKATLTQIITAILNQENSPLLKQYNITYKVLN